MERYLVAKARNLSKEGSRFFVIYESKPKSKKFREDFVDVGGRLYDVKLQNFYSLDAYKQIYKIIIENNIDIVHTYFTPTCHYLNLYLSLRGFRNLVRTAANFPLTKANTKRSLPLYLKFYFSLRQQCLSRLVRKILCRSEGVRNQYRKLGVSSKKLDVTSGGVDIDYYQFLFKGRDKIRKKYDLNSNMLILGTSCRLTPLKRIDKLIKIMSELNSPDQNIKLYIAGDGPESDNLKDLVKSLKIEDAVKFLGHQEDISELYSVFDVFCLPSEIEGMSNSVLEAMACELPIIASDILPNRELIDEEKGGYLISFKDNQEFQERIEKLLDKRTRRIMGKYNRHKVSSRFSLEKRIEEEFEIYKQLYF
jgi:glycosyltransferase involved in cell wall biosynthesis